MSEVDNSRDVADTVPEGAYAGLCLMCGTVKDWLRATCPECGADPGYDDEVESLCSERWLHRDSLQPLGEVLEKLLKADLDRPTRGWTLAYYVKRDIPYSVLPIKIPRRRRKRAEKLIIDLALPDIKVRQSPWIMPHDWDAHEAWDSYYSSWGPDSRYLSTGEDSWQIFRFDDWVGRLKSRNVQRIWFPGCGLDALPWAYAAAGFDVVATDASRTAIEIQRSDEFHLLVLKDLDRLDPPIRQRLENRETLELRFEAHDFREPLEEAGFDCIINIQAFQALSPYSMARAARAYWASLRPGGIAYLSMLNVDHLDANGIERVLSEAGFFVPFELAERELRTGLDDLGAGISPFGTFHIEVRSENQKGVIWELRRRWKKRKLDRLRAAYDAAKAGQEELVGRARNDGITKFVEVLYNTG